MTIQKQIEKMLRTIKDSGIAISTVEQDLGFANATLGKAKKGLINLTEDKFAKLEAYYQRINTTSTPDKSKKPTPDELKKLHPSIKKASEVPPPKKKKAKAIACDSTMERLIKNSLDSSDNSHKATMSQSDETLWRVFYSFCEKRGVYPEEVLKKLYKNYDKWFTNENKRDTGKAAEAGRSSFASDLRKAKCGIE